MSAFDPVHFHDVIDLIAAATTPGQAIDCIPDDWSRMLVGPDLHGFHFSLKPVDGPAVLERVYERGLGMGRGPTQLEAITSAVEWIRTRVPRPAPTA